MSNSKSTLSKLFCLEGLFLDRMEVGEKTIDLYVRSPRTFAICPHCANSTSRVNCKTDRTVKHMVCDDKIVRLGLSVRNFKCNSCKYIFREYIPGIDGRSTSEHFRQKVIPKLRDRSFQAVAQEHSISPSSLSRCTVNLKDEVGIKWPAEPFALGIDEHSFAGRDFVITITDLTNHRLLAILPDDKQSTLRQFIKNIPANTRKLITGVCIDMKSSYAQVAKDELKNIPVVIDKFHVIQFFNWHLSQLRLIYTNSNYPLPKQLFEKNREDLNKREKDKLKDIFKRYPPIEELWRIKEFVRTMYRVKDPIKAREKYQVLLAGLDDPRSRWQSMRGTLIRWQKPILNYFDLRITNAYTEGVHTRIKLLKRISYGFRNKTNYIAKMTLAFMPMTVLLDTMNRHPI